MYCDRLVRGRGNLCNVCHGLFTLRHGLSGRLYFVILVQPGHLLYNVSVYTRFNKYYTSFNVIIYHVKKLFFSLKDYKLSVQTEQNRTELYYAINLRLHTSSI